MSVAVRQFGFPDVVRTVGSGLLLVLDFQLIK